MGKGFVYRERERETVRERERDGEREKSEGRKYKGRESDVEKLV